MTDYSLALSRDRPSHDRDAFSRRHPKMSLQNRAKIFAPFDALPDLRWKVAERQKITRPPARLTEDARELLDRKLRWLDRYCRSDPDRDRPPAVITVVYFQRDPRAEELNGDGIRGNYLCLLSADHRYENPLRGYICPRRGSVPASGGSV